MDENEHDESPSDCYLTVGAPLEIMAALWPRGADLDPFHDPRRKGASLGRTTFDLRRGEDAYTLPWVQPNVARVWCNGPYSGRNPGRTAKACARWRSEGLEILNLCPAAPGSDYWKRYVWPWATAIAWCGRLAFQAAVDMPDKTGAVRVKAGTVAGGNRTEISLVHMGDDPDRFVTIARSLGGYPAQVL